MAEENNKSNLKKPNNELLQLLISVAVIGVFLLVEIWLIFYYGQGYVFPLIFGILIILMSCLFTLNIYQIFIKRTAMSGGSSDKKAEFLIYKQIKALPDVFEKELNQKLEALNEEFSKTQKKTAKAVLIKVDEQIASLQTQEGKESDSNMSEQFDNMKAEISELKEQISELKSYNEELSNRLNLILKDNEDVKGGFSDLKSEHKRVFDLLGSLAFRNDEIMNALKVSIDKDKDFFQKEIADESIAEQPDNDNEIPLEEILGTDAADYDPNKQLTPEVIANMFANV